MKKITFILVSIFALIMAVGCSDSNNSGTDSVSQNQTTAAVQTTATAAGGSGATTATAQQNVIGEAKAKEIALKKVNGASESDIIKFKFEVDDGRQEYEGEIIYNEREYDFEIDAVTGDILSWEEESIYN